jgi:uncharacterized protein (TIGR01777 family)
MKKIIITAANGFIGRKLAEYFVNDYEVVALVRGKVDQVEGVKYLEWNGRDLGDWQLEFEGAECVINMAGRSVDCRYNEKNKAQIYSSRLESTKVLGEAIESCINPPKLWINSASATIYRYSEDTPMTEKAGEIGTGFSVDVCQQWEGMFYSFAHSKLRQVALRTTIVLGNGGGAMAPMVRLVRFGMGGKQGKGNQMFSWIHAEDFCRAVAFIIETPEIEGPVNMAAPFPLTNNEFMKTLRRVYRAPFGIPVPRFLLEFGARIIRTETELILKSRFVIPEKLMQHGFIFHFPDAETAAQNIKNTD